jgi:tight adherence protein C
MSMVLAIGILGGVTIAALLIGIRTLVANPRDEVLERVHRVTTTAEFPVAGGAASRAPRRSLIAAWVRPLSRLSTPEEGKDLTKARKNLAHAGYRREGAVEIFFGAKIAFGLVLVSPLMIASAVAKERIANDWMYAIVLGALGFYAPNLFLRSRIKARQLELSKALPDTLDLLVTCVEAGLGVEAAIARVTQEITLSAPLLASELKQTTNEIQAGVARADAFRKLADRTGLDELRTLAASLIQTEMFGTSIAGALRVHSDAMRVRRTHRAEEAAATVAVKMMLPLIFCILPSLFAIILGPAIVRIVQALLPTLRDTGSLR